MTREQLRAACRLAGGVTALARLIDVPRLYIYRRLGPVGKKMSKPDTISRRDELAILKALKLRSVRHLDVEKPTRPDRR